MMSIDQSGVFLAFGRQRAIYVYRVSLYAPGNLAPVSAVDIEAKDEAFEASPRYINVPAFYFITPEYARTDAAGLTKEDSVLVSDQWWFLADQEVSDGWLVVMTACAGQKPHPLLGRAWVAQGNSEINAPLPGRPADSQWVYAKLSPTDIVPALG